MVITNLLHTQFFLKKQIFLKNLFFSFSHPLSLPHPQHLSSSHCSTSDHLLPTTAMHDETTLVQPQLRPTHFSPELASNNTGVARKEASVEQPFRRFHRRFGLPPPLWPSSSQDLLQPRHSWSKPRRLKHEQFRLKIT